MDKLFHIFSILHQLEQIIIKYQVQFKKDFASSFKNATDNDIMCVYFGPVVSRIELMDNHVIGFHFGTNDLLKWCSKFISEEEVLDTLCFVLTNYCGLESCSFK